MTSTLWCNRGHVTHYAGSPPTATRCPECEKQDQQNAALAQAIAVAVTEEIEAMLVRHGLIKPQQ